LSKYVPIPVVVLNVFIGYVDGRSHGVLGFIVLYSAEEPVVSLDRSKLLVVILFTVRLLIKAEGSVNWLDPVK